MSYDIKLTSADLNKVTQCIRLAYKLKDDQLKSELFSLYAGMNYWDDTKFLLYNFKAILIQKKLGVKLFNFDQNRFFQISSALYRAEKYDESINYGLQSLDYMQHIKKIDTMDYIFQYDIIGASYLKQKKLDSAIHYYQSAENILKQFTFDREIMQTIWTAIAKGRIGQALILKGDEKRGVPLVKEYLTKVKESKDSINIAIGENILASVNYDNSKYVPAVTGFRAGYLYAKQIKLVEEEITALHGLAKTFTKLKMADSAFKYFNLYEQQRDKRKDWLNSIETEKLKSEMALEILQNDIEKANLKMKSEKLLRNLILAIIALATTVTIFLVMRRLNKIKTQNLNLVIKQKSTESQMLEARKRVEEFSQHIMAKDRIIYDLSKSLKLNKTDTVEKNGENPLLKYILVTEQEMAKFRTMVADAYPGFFVRLESILENVTPAEERLASLICLKLNDRQMAAMLGISKESVARSKRRLKQKLTLPEGENLEDYIYKIATAYSDNFDIN